MSDTIDTSKMFLDADALMLAEQLQRAQEARQEKIGSYGRLCSTVIDTVAIGLYAYTIDAETTADHEEVRRRYQNDPRFHHSVKNIAAQLMRVFDRYDPNA